MASYVIMEPPKGGMEKAVLVRDAFTPIAFLAPALWLFWHRLWVEAVATLGLRIALFSFGALATGSLSGSAVSFLVSLLFALEGPSIRLAAMRRRGWKERGVVEAHDISEAEVRFVEVLRDHAEQEHQKLQDLSVPISASPIAYSTRPAQPALGMLGYPARGS